MQRGGDSEHRARKQKIRNCREREIIEKAFEMAALDEKEAEAMRLYIYKRVPIGIIAERMGYEKSYFSRTLFKKAVVKYVYCLEKVTKERGE